MNETNTGGNMKAFTFFKRSRNNKGEKTSNWIIASYHNPNSFTWRWSIGYSPYFGKPGFYFFRTSRYHGFNFQAGLKMPVLGWITMQTQPHVWQKI